MHLSDIYCYPVKSLAGFKRDSAVIEPIGLNGDRRMMLVDQQGVFISQRSNPQMALVRLTEHEQAIEFQAPGLNPLKLNLSGDSFSQNTETVEVWGDRCSGHIAPDEANQWFSQYLQRTVRLVSYDNNQPRGCDPDYSSPGDHVSFADGFPILLISQASLDDLNSRLDKKLSMRSFRPNLVVTGCEPYAEDSWRQIRIGEASFDLVKTCSRCVLTTVDPDTGEKSADGEPLKTLSQYRRGEGGVLFGMNLIPRSDGEVKLGDKIEIVASG